MGFFGDVGGLIGGLNGQDDADKAKALAEQQGTAFNQVSLPDWNKMQVTPEQQQGTEFDRQQRDPVSMQAQQQALAGMMARGNEGYTATDRAANQGTLNDFNQNEAGNRGAIMQNMQARGMGGSGNELAAQLANQQGSATRANNAGTNLAAGARAQALSSLMAGGGMASTMRSQQAQEQQARAAAQDAINARNADYRSKAGYHNAGVQQQQFQNQMGLTGAKAGGMGRLSDFYLGREQRSKDSGKQAGDAVDSGVAAVGDFATGLPDEGKSK